MSKRLKIFQANFDAKANAYKGYYQKPVNIFQNGKRHRVEILREYVRASRPTSILDIGCGPGIVLEEIRKVSRAKRSFGIDFSWAMLCHANEVHLLNGNFVQASAENLPFSDGIFEFAYALGVIGYVFSPPVFIREVQRILKPEGIFAFTCPNGDSFSRKLRDFVLRHSSDQGLLWARRLPSQNVKRWLIRSGFKLVKCHFIIYGNGIIHFPWSIPLSSIMERIISRTKLSQYLAWSGLWIVKKI
ncbi:MAG: class I SAM-dependent methyltransferase [Deltaproteobacteria bacterium]|nr:class I SAM-dependent methyltransferase [Deltaproteobacteria bacterium]